MKELSHLWSGFETRELKGRKRVRWESTVRCKCNKVFVGRGVSEAKAIDSAMSAYINHAKLLLGP